ncbi:signal protein PDZ [Azospirillum sp. TSO22-1]|nr:signal protein PDZ [Azospirillum sp. TSO22-1]
MEIRVLTRLLPLLLLAGCASAAVESPSPATQQAAGSDTTCATPGRWHDARGGRLTTDAVLRRTAAAPAVFLGERHDSFEHHRWQLQTLTAIHALNPNIAIGLEMLPRSKQAALDRWVAGELSEAEMLRDTDWATLWGMDPQLYLPILHFVRMNRVPLLAVNIDRGLVGRTRKEGWAAVPEAERQGVGNPAPPPAGYIDYLAAALGMHDEGGKDKPSDASKGPDRNAPEFRRFVEAQSVWDRAMAERIASYRKETGRTVVTIVGYGHIEKRFGIPHQLESLGVGGAAVLLPWDGARTCAMLDGTVADAVFGLAPTDEVATAPKPRLGVTLEPGKDGLRIVRIGEDSIAAHAGLAVDDVLETAAGTPIHRLAEVTAVVQRQAPGTWMPITVKRKGKTRTFVAKFPAQQP